MHPNMIIKHYKQELRQAQAQMDRLEDEKAFQSRVLNTIRELLLTRTNWNGVFHKEETLATIIQEYLETKDVQPRSPF